MSVPVPDRRGLQPERTALAWQRTTITSTVSLLALVAIAVRLQDWVLLGLFSLAAVAGASLVLGVRTRLTDLRGERVTVAPYAAMTRVAGATCLAALGGLMAGVRLYFG